MGVCTGVEPCVDLEHCDEEADICLDCVRDEECGDEVFCNGEELCVDGFCADGPNPCEDDAHCDEEGGVCLECISNDECRDDVWCDGPEFCINNACESGQAPCEEDEICDEENERCVDCLVNEDCDDENPCTLDLCVAFDCSNPNFSDDTPCPDGLFCNGDETCQDGVCEDGEDVMCPEGETCNEDQDMCVPGCGRDPVWICDGDVDGDGQVNPVDSGLIQSVFGTTDEQDLCNYDIDCDGQINPVDAGIVQSLFGTCDAPRDECQ